MASELLLLIATIVAGEAVPSPAGRELVAYNVYCDVMDGQDLAARWFGRAEPTPPDIYAAWQALAGQLGHLPRCSFLGTPQDLDRWHWLDGSERVLTVTDGRLTSVCVLPQAQHQGKGEGWT